MRGIGLSEASVCVRTLKRKRLELSTPNSVHVYSMAGSRHALSRRLKGQRSRSHGYENGHGRTVASELCCRGRVLLLPASDCTSYHSHDCLDFYTQNNGVRRHTGLTHGFYRAMHYSAKRGLAIACRLSVCPPVTFVDHYHIG